MDRRLRDARQGLAQPGEACRSRRAPDRRDLPAAALPLPRSRGGDRARNLRGLPLCGDPLIPRHAHAARLRRLDPHDRGGG